MKPKIKIVKFISIICTITFLWQEIAQAYPDMFYSLRPLAALDRTERPQIPWSEGSGAQRGIDDFKQYISDGDFADLKTAKTFFDRLFILGRALGLSDIALSRYIGCGHDQVRKWRLRQPIWPNPVVTARISSRMHVDTLFFMEGGTDIEAACQKRSVPDRIRFAMLVEGITIADLAERMGVSSDDVKQILKDVKTHGQLVNVARALNAKRESPRWHPVLLEFGLNPPTCGLCRTVDSRTSFLTGGRGRHRMMAVAQRLADRLNLIWAGEGKYPPVTIDAWSKAIRPVPYVDEASGGQVREYQGVTGSLIAAAMISAEKDRFGQAQHYQLLTPDVIRWLLRIRGLLRKKGNDEDINRWLEDPACENLAHQLAKAHDDLENFFNTTGKSLCPPMGYYYGDMAERIGDGAWFLLSRHFSLERLLVILNEFSEDYGVFKSNLFATGNPERVMKERGDEIVRLCVREAVVAGSGFRLSDDVIARVVWSVNKKKVEQMLDNMRMLAPKLLKYAQDGWVVPCDYAGKVIWPKAYVAQALYHGLSNVADKEETIRSRSALLQQALERKGQLPASLDALNRVFAWIEFLNPPSPLVVCTNAAPSDTETAQQKRYLDRNGIIMAFVDAVSSSASSRAVTSGPDMYRTLAEGMLELHSAPHPVGIPAADNPELIRGV